jgi:integrase
MRRLLAAAPPRYRVPIATGLFSGLRVAEVLGLVWGNVDFAKGELHVRAQMGRDGKRRPLKTGAAMRDVILMPQLAHELRQHRLASSASDERDLVFTTRLATTIGTRNLTSRGIEKARDSAGLPGVTFHTLRHTFASLLIAQGHDPVFVSRQLGHASPTITLNTYAHLFDNARHARAARDQLDAEYRDVLTDTAT